MADLLDGLFRFTGASEIPITDSANPTRVQSNDDRGRSGILKLVGTLTASRELILPYYVGSWEIQNTTSQTVTIRGETGATVAVPAASAAHIFCDGLGFFTASGTGEGGVSDHGALTGLADNDHPQYQLAANAIGLTSSTPQPVGTAAVGNGTSAARDNHVHAHGDQAGGSLHAVATTSVPGFLSAADKTKLDSLTGGATNHGVLAGLTNDDHLQYLRSDGWRTWTGAQNAGGNKITNLGTPTADADAATKAYVDSVGGGGGSSIPSPTAANQVYNSSAAGTAAWTDDPVVDTLKAITKAEVGTYAANAASGAGQGCILIAQGGGASSSGGFCAIAGGAPGAGGTDGGGAGLYTRGSEAGGGGSHLLIEACEIGGRKLISLNAGVRATSAMMPTGDRVVTMGPAGTIPTSAPTETNHAGFYVGNISGGGGKLTHVCGGGVTYQAVETITVGAGTTGFVVLGQILNGGQPGSTANQVKRGTATGRINVIQLQPSSSWTGHGGSSNYAKYLGFTATLYWSGSIVIPCLDLCPLDGTALVGSPAVVYLEMDASYNVLCKAQNQGGIQCEFVISWDWNQRF